MNIATDITDDQLSAKLRAVGLRATRPRLDLVRLLFTGENRHLTAESLHEEVQQAGHKMSLATIYNSLHQFTEAGLLRQVVVDSTRSYFDTNTSEHHHFFISTENRLIDIPAEKVSISDLPDVPAGLDISGVDVIIRLHKKS
ncbi:MAG: iron response transcriptional regulator IrrA [Parvibaculales bacterium]